jgi:hypothetical protein
MINYKINFKNLPIVITHKKIKVVAREILIQTHRIIIQEEILLRDREKKEEDMDRI